MKFSLSLRYALVRRFVFEFDKIRMGDGFGGAGWPSGLRRWFTNQKVAGSSHDAGEFFF